MSFLERLEESIDFDKPVNDGLALKIFSENVCDQCDCKK